MIGLILIDIDGTLVGTGNQIHASTWPALERAREAGVHLALCTGRPCVGYAKEYAEKISPNTPHVFQSGAVVCSPAGKILSVSPLPSKSYARLVEFARSQAEALEVYTATECFVERHSSLTLRHAEAIGLPVQVQDLFSIPGPIVRVQWVVRWQEWPKFEAFTAKDNALEISVATQPDIVESCFSSVTAKGISKASAAKTLAEHFGLDTINVAMVGDGNNDIDVVQAVGLGIAMGNATENLKAVADVMVGNVDAGGLSEAIDLVLARNEK